MSKLIMEYERYVTICIIRAYKHNVHRKKNHNIDKKKFENNLRLFIYTELLLCNFVYKALFYDQAVPLQYVHLPKVLKYINKI